MVELVPFLLVPVLALAAVAALLVASRRNRLVAAATTMVLLLTLVWIAAFAAAASGYRDADGFIDCWPNCSFVQNATGTGLFYGPAIALLVIVTTVLIAFVQRRRRG